MNESIIEALALEIRGLKSAIAKLTDRLSEAAGLWESTGYAVQPNLFHINETSSSGEGRTTISNPQDVWKLCKDMRTLTQERLDVLLLNTRNTVTKRETVFLGSLNETMMQPREIFALAIKHRAASVIIVHNHPSGNAEPSNEDIRATEALKQAGDLLKIPVQDHIIIGDNFTSLKEDGHL